MPAFSAFFCYSLIFYVVKKTKQLYDISNKTVAIVLFFIMTTSIYISVIGGIRMMIALAMITFSYFRMTVEKKIKIIDLLFFATSIFMHAMSLVAICIAALALLFDSGKNVIKKIGYVFFIVAIGGVFAVKFNRTVQGLFEKFLTYVLGEKHSDRWEYAMGVFIVLTLILVFSEIHHIQKSVDCLAIDECNRAAVFCVVLSISFCFEFSIFYRFGGHLAVLFAIPSMMVSIEKAEEKPIALLKKFELRRIVILLSLIIAVISCTRGSLSALKFFEL